MHSVVLLVSERHTTNMCIAHGLYGNVIEIGDTVHLKHYFDRTKILSFFQKIFGMFQIKLLFFL